MIYRSEGFTLIELMVVVVIVAIFAAIAIPSYQEYARRAIAAQAQIEVQKLAEQLERHKSKNFSYKGFNARYLYPTPPSPRLDSFDDTKQELILPLESAHPKYVITIVDAGVGNPLLTATTALGQNWVIQAVSSDTRNFSFLVASNGVRCKNKTVANITYTGCGVGGENW
ncbi:prepilin-type N-terminal cleavage/methylation domain-containing protein [Acinetobacter junii]|uniref:prepilin-type N-terminal cleavage/methylation domain-containing protein n=1 Tax=Acinetobacter junii TaxID=40215 RepID=UPI000579EC1A|nr:prepilin-type N-terminal cleavage/methylation domain-containing protein [Acinetobacter junii]VTX74469.1 Fimbrial protein [Acinetobacter junii]